ncbi:MAG: immunoglobulin domain-containing protein [Verrucomicrobia bacterium]|nr:immunoglobulin domain-containing protein [Verrucomicrobiota bacterium]
MIRLKPSRFLWLALVTLVMASGGTHGVLAATTVTVTSHAELEAKILEARSNGGDGIITFDSDGTVTLTNQIRLAHSSTSTNLTTDVIRLSAVGHSITIAGPTGTNFLNGGLFLLDRGVELYVTNIMFINGKGTNGSAFYVSSNSALYAVDCVFSNNVATGSNGVSGTSARVDTVSGSAKDGGTGKAGVNAAGGAIYNLGRVWLNGCAFLTNGVYGGNGGLGGNGGNGTVRAGDGGSGGRGGGALGGAIYNQGQVFTDGCSFYGNYVLGGLGGDGGTAGSGIFAGFNGKGAVGGAAAGGAIYNHPKSSATNLNTTFALNVTDSGDSADGGSNSARGKTGAGGPHSAGGAIANFGTNILGNCTFFSNGVNAGNGGSGSDGSSRGGRGGNGGSAWGGNVFNGKKAVIIATHCTISDGGATGGTNGLSGGGSLPGVNGDKGLSRGANVANSNGVFTLRNSIVAYPANGTNSYYAGKTFTFLGRNISSDRSFKLSGVPRAQVTQLLTNLDPKLDTLARNGGIVETLRLLDGSPAIRYGLTNYGLDLDARGVGRPSGTNADLGAYQYGVGLVAPTILQQPVDTEVLRSNTAIFTVTAQGDPPLTYQWRRNGSAISNATSSVYVLTNAQLSSEGAYDVVVANNSGSVESDDASLSVVIPATITRQPSGLILAPGATGTFSVTAEGDGTLSYQWLSNGVVILGATRTTFTLTNAHPLMNANYSVRVGNQYRTVVSTAASLVVTSIPPVMEFSPTNYSVLGGNSASFTAAVSVGTVPLTFLWYLVKDGATNLQAPLQSFELTNTYTISDAQAANDGSYFVVVTNHGGRATSELASLTVQLVAPMVTTDIEDQTVAEGEDASFHFSVFGSRPITFQWYTNETTLISGATNFSLTLTNLSTNSGGTYSIVASNSAGMVTSRVATVTITNLPPSISVQPAAAFTTRGEDATFTVTARGTKPFTYQWYFNGDAITNATNATLTVDNVDIEDTQGTYFVEVTNDYGFDSSDDTATVYLLEPVEVDCDDPTCAITMPQVDEDNMEYYYTLQYRASANDAWLGVETLGPDDFRADFEYSPQPFNADSGAYRVVITEFPPEGQPTIDGDLEDQGVPLGQSAVFTLSVNSAEPISYRWYFNDELLAGETNPTLIVTNAVPEDAGSYYAVAYGILGASTSAVVTLTVVTDPAPAIIEDPVGVGIYSGENATLSVRAFGAVPLTYRWFLNDTNLVATVVNSSSLVLSNVQTADAGLYHVVVSNQVGVATSAAASLVVSNVAPILTSLSPIQNHLTIPATFTLSVGVTGSQPFTYQWYIIKTSAGSPMEPELLPGETNSSYSASALLRRIKALLRGSTGSGDEPVWND